MTHEEFRAVLAAIEQELGGDAYWVEVTTTSRTYQYLATTNIRFDEVALFYDDAAKLFIDLRSVTSIKLLVVP